MGITDTLRRLFPVAYREARDLNGPGGNISFVDWAGSFKPGQYVNYQGQTYQGFTRGAGGPGGAYYDTNSVVFACTANRMLLFSEARFQFQQMRGGRPGDLFGNDALSVLENPWVGASTGDLLTRAELGVTLHGNSYWVRDGAFLLRLDPSRVSILTEGVGDDVYGRIVGERLLAYAYTVGHDKVVFYEPDEVAHYKPYPDKANQFLGVSWLNACLPDIEADVSMQTHKTHTLDSGAKLGIIVTLNGVNGQGPSPEQFTEYVSAFRATHEGPANAGKTLFLGPGSDVKTIGQSFESLDMKATQGAGETRIAACAGVPPVIVGLSEGLSSATYSNYSQARRRLVDGTMRPLWRMFASAMQSLVKPPTGARLWYDDRDIPFLREDVKDQAEILQMQTGAIRQLVDAGYDPDAVIAAVRANDVERLVGAHSGLYSVQLQPPGTTTAPTDDTPALNGQKALPAAQTN
jgi:phage portal protein BeeE